MDEQLKARSFRLSEEVTNKLKQLCENFDNQNAALSAMINAYEVQNAKATIVDRQTDIADYDTHIQAIQSAFLRSLELNENAEQRIRVEFRNLLDSKDKMIMQLQADKAQADEQTEKYKSAYGNLITSTEEKIQAMQIQVSESENTLQSEKERANTEQKAREQAETISKMLSNQVEETKVQLEQLKKQISELTKRAEQAENKAMELSNSLSKLQISHSDIEKTLANERTAHEQELAIIKREKETAIKYTTAEVAGKYQHKIEELQKQQAEQLAILLNIRNNSK